MKKLDIWEIADNLEFIANELEILVKKDVKNKILNYSRRLREIHEEKKLKAFDLKNCIKRIEESGNWHLNDSEYGKLKKEWYELIIKIIKSNIKENPCQQKEKN